MTAPSSTLDLRRPVGKFVLNGLAHVGRLSLMVGEMARTIGEWRIWLPRTFTEMWNIGVGSFPIVVLVSGFAGAVTALQTGYQFSGNIPYYVVGTLIVESIVLELGPVLTALVLAGRIGARYAAELGTMRVTEQIDALDTLATNPMKYLVVPRVLAGLIMMPALVLVADVIGVMGGFIVSSFILKFNESAYLINTIENMHFKDIFSGLVKAAVFGLIITTLGCFNGYNSRGGAQGVGLATTNAVVYASVLILFFDYFLTVLFLTQ
jgi:phospholipid/cholesterol/gamma-HCH transport system permease protein